MAADSAPMATEKATHAAHRASLLALFRARPFEEISGQALKELVGDNYMQRISEARRGEDGLKIECVPRYAEIDGRRKRITGDFVWRPEALGRDAAWSATPQRLPLYDGPISGWQR